MRIWHYTNAAGLLGILERKELWASSLAYMNDSTEGMYGRSALARAIREASIELRDSSHEDDYSWMYLQYSAQWLDGGYPQDLPDPRLKIEAYAACFCKSGDLLSQWRGYGGEGGFAICFESEALPKSVGGALVSHRGVTYGSQTVTSFRAQVENLLAVKADLTDDDLDQLQREAIWHKHDSFEEESEYRLSILDPPPEMVEVRAVGIRLLPFVRVPVDSSAILGVRVGPGADTGRQVNATRLALTRYGFSNVMVDSSQAPFVG